MEFIFEGKTRFTLTRECRPINPPIVTTCATDFDDGAVRLPQGPCVDVVIRPA
jgi:hypothetical protein